MLPEASSLWHVFKLSGGWLSGAMGGKGWQAQCTAVWEDNDLQYPGVTSYLGPCPEVSSKVHTIHAFIIGENPIQLETGRHSEDFSFMLDHNAVFAWGTGWRGGLCLGTMFYLKKKKNVFKIWTCTPNTHFPKHLRLKTRGKRRFISSSYASCGRCLWRKRSGLIPRRI